MREWGLGKRLQNIYYTHYCTCHSYSKKGYELAVPIRVDTRMSLFGMELELTNTVDHFVFHQ